MVKDETLNAFQLTLDLAKTLNNSLLNSKLPKLKSNKIGEQFWCIIGARESYLKAINNSEWQGFSCSINDCFSENEITQKLKETQNSLNSISERLTKRQEEFLFDLYTHEIQHHGQLIRFCYALEIDFPKSWNKKYTV